jgi:hypothetical protein
VIAGLEGREYYRQYRIGYYAKNRVALLAKQNALREENPARRLFNSAKCRAKRGGLEFSISHSDIVVPSHCHVLGIKLFTTPGLRGPRDNTPSVERIDPTKGYVSGNVMVVSMRANQIKNNASVVELRRIADFYEGIARGL